MSFIYCFFFFSFRLSSVSKVLLPPYPHYPSFFAFLCWWTSQLMVACLLPYIHAEDSFCGLMYGPCRFLLCLIQLFKAPCLHVKLHGFSPFFSLACSLSHLYVYALSAYSDASLACASKSKAWPSCQNSPLSHSSPGCYLSNKPASFTSKLTPG